VESRAGQSLRRHAGEHPDEVALAQALVLGRGELLSDEMRDSFRRGGTYHLLVFSGLQIAFAAGLLAALLRWLHAPRASDWLLLAFAARAAVHRTDRLGRAREHRHRRVRVVAHPQRPTSLENLWCVAALLRLLLEPGDLSDASFHLTYAGAGALLFHRQALSTHRRITHRRGDRHRAADALSLSPVRPRRLAGDAGDVAADLRDADPLLAGVRVSVVSATNRRAASRSAAFAERFRACPASTPRRRRVV
jgi:hypothetical protein